MSEHTPELTPGQQIAHYSIERQLAEGGGGTVFLAEDNKLHRKVVLKVLKGAPGPRRLDGDLLLKEARAAAALNHPNIVSVFDLVEAQGHLVIVMEWVDGEPLSACAGKLPPRELCAVASDLASALAAAHRSGVIHGDIKPGNVILARDGRARLLDFGIARRTDDRPVSGEQFAGTIPYMSPELIRGAEPSAQSDLWALGVLLFELAAGERPFGGDYEAAIQYAIMHTRPQPVRSRRPELPSDLAQVIDRLLSRDPALRYADAGQLIEDLRECSGRERPGRVPFAGKRRTAIWVAVVLACAVAGTLYFGRGAEERPEGRVLAVLPFENLGDSTQNYFADGMTDALISLLARDTQLSVISRPSVMLYQHSRLPLKSIAAELSADHVVTGTIRRDGDAASGHLRVSALLTSAASGRTLWQKVYDERAAQLFQVQARLASDIHSALGLGSDSVGAQPGATPNLGAYDLYLRGNDYFNRGWSADDIRFAIEMYTEAVRADSTFAPAFAMLARGHASLFWEYYDRTATRCREARRAVDRALALDAGLADAHLALGYYYYHCELDFLRALESFRRALQLEPKNADVLNAVAAVERRQGNLPMAAEHFEASLALDPLSYLKAFDVGLTYGLMREYGQANRYLDRAITLGPDFPLAHIYKAWLAILQSGDRDSARAILARAAAGAHLERSHYYWWLQRIVAPDLPALLQQVPRLDDTAAYYLFKSQIYRLTHDAALQRACADSARAWLEPRLDAAPHAARYFSYLGLAYANLGLKEQALQSGREALAMLPTSRDSFDALFLLINMAEILLVVGEQDPAMAQIEDLLTLPGFVSMAYFRCDPLWEPLRGHPRFQKLGAAGT